LSVVADILRTVRRKVVMAKRCTKCGVERALEEFPRRGKRRGSWCRECVRVHDRESYRTNQERRRRVAETRTRPHEAIICYLRDFLLEHPCVDCGETDPVVLEFDHVRGTKIAAVSALARNASIKTVVDEVAKCEVRCGNCHRRKTARERNWWIWRKAEELRRLRGS
jgi:hypothetical protein